jgi:hypothetical protein
MTEESFLSFVRRLISCFLLVLPCALLGHAQNNGTVGIATKEVPVFAAQTTTLSSGGTWQCNNSPTPIACAVLPDFGAGCNFLSYQTTGFSGTITLEWSPPLANSSIFAPFIVLTQASYSASTPDTAVHVLQLGGYFPNLRSTVTPSAGSLSAQYTASAAPCPLVSSGLGSNGPEAPIVCDRNALVSITTGSTAEIAGPLVTGDTVVICAWTLSFNGATSAGNVTIEWGTSAACSSVTGPSWYIYTTSATPQVLAVAVPQRSPFNATYPYACLLNASGASGVFSFSYASVHGL